MMHFAKQIAAFSLCLLSVKAATYTQAFCQTQMGTNSVANVPKSTKTLTVPLVVLQKTTTIPTTTVVPPSVTQTATATSTTTTTTAAPANQLTATSTDTVSITVTKTDMQTQSVTITAATTTLTTLGTITISATPGFTAIKDEPGYVAKREVADHEKRREAHGFAARAGAGWTRATQSNVLKLDKTNHLVSPNKFPQSVQCLVLIEPIATKVLTVTAKATATTTQAPGTVLQTITVVATATAISYPPDVTSTVTVSTTQTITIETISVTTTTTTTTASVYVNDPASPTTYAACQSNNFANAANGNQRIVAYSPHGTHEVVLSDRLSSYDVCVQCQGTPGCIFFVGDETNRLYISGDGTCNPGMFGGPNFFTSDLVGSGYGYTIGNGPCGLIANGGVE